MKSRRLAVASSQPDFPATSAKLSAAGDEESSLSRLVKMLFFPDLFPDIILNVNFIDHVCPATSAITSTFWDEESSLSRSVKMLFFPDLFTGKNFDC